MFDDETKREIAEIAKSIDVAPAALLAVADVESGGRVFAKIRGKKEPLIRFEGHYFDRFLRGDAKQEARAEGLANPKAGAVKNPGAQTARWRLLNRAIRINRIAALSSTSWGLGQVMGAHWKWLGYGSVDALVEQVRSGAAGQVKLMVRYIKKAGLINAMQERDWSAFARRYNGPNYRKHGYDKKLEAAFMRYTKEAEAPSLPKATSTAANDNSTEPKFMFGSRGEGVKQLQKSLTRLGYVLVADGLYGLVTDRVVRQFQRDQFLDVSGIISTAEREIIFGAANPIKRVAKSVNTQISKTTDKTTVKLKDTVKSIKRSLRKGLLSISRHIT